MNSSQADEDFLEIADIAVNEALADANLLAAAVGVISKDDLKRSIEHDRETWPDDVIDELRDWRIKTAERQKTLFMVRGSIRSSLEEPTSLGGLIRRYTIYLNKHRITQETEDRAQRNRRFRDASAAAEQSKRQLVDSLRQRCALPAFRTAVNNALSEDGLSDTLAAGSAAGLDQLLPAGFELKSTARTRLERMMATLSTASVGIAGPRGSGKTTLLEWSCEKDRSRGRFCVLVNAPVHYEARDYLLYLLAALCKAYLRHANEPLTPPREATRGVNRDWLRPFVIRYLTSAAILLGSSVLIGTAGLSLTKSTIVPITPLANSIIGLSLAVLIYVTASVVRRESLEPIKLALTFKDPSNASLAIFASRSFLAVRVIAGLGIVALSVLWYLGTSPSYTTILISTALLAGFTAFQIAGRARSAGWDIREQEPRRIREYYGSGRDALRGELPNYVRETLLRATHQKAVSLNRADRLGVSGSFGVTVSADTTTTSGESITTIPWTKPELVEEIRSILSRITRDRHAGTRITIAIDELDKIATTEQAIQFIDDIKSIFGVVGCHYLIAVSNDALSDFERRGMPFRNAFDSAFDDIIPLEYFELADSIHLLRTRVIAIPRQFCALCHALSGGLPRDLLRIARRLYDLDLPVKLEDAAFEIICDELDRKVALLTTTMKATSSQSWANDIVAWTSEFEITADSLDVFLEAAQALMKIGVSAAESEAGSSMTAEDVKAIRVSNELAAFIYYCETVMQISRNRELDANQIVDLLTSAASIRQAFSIHPALAWARTSALRAQVMWSQIDISRPE